MTHRILRAAIVLSMTLASLTLQPAAVSGQTAAVDPNNPPGTKTAWSVFSDENPKECWGVAKPKRTTNTRDGKEVSVKRSDILMFVTFRPSLAGAEISFSGGYPFAANSAVDVEIDGAKFQMTIIDGEYAWADDLQASNLLAAMQQGAEAILTAHSAKGTQTEDIFSLSGFTAAMTEAKSLCD